ncbi:aminodeoxychorismate synthase component I [Perlucidibaca aquatica]|uniref:aminodeoxychorismate synthase component I n=1 Tax=Perlucidibaca aquatica TaxID=1852776 RepID=UPI00083A766E|nr:aminodeoxychorismate synthase component I [Perlucidibaca aquatica]
MRLHELAWTDSPEAALAAVRDLPWPLLLDSQAAGRWDILVAAPRAYSWQTPAGWQHTDWPATHLASDADAFAVMQGLQDWGGPEQARLEAAQDWPFVQGVMGCLGYASASERGLPTPRHDDWPLAILAYYDQGCVWDHEQRRCFAWSLNAQTWPDWLARLQSATAAPCQPLQLTAPFQALTSQPRYAADIARIHDFIRAGDCYQVNYTQAYEARCEGELWDAYPTLRPLALAPYAAYWRLPWGEILCLSPEQFLGIHQQRITTRPIKGTRRRQTDATADAAEASALLASAKDMAENIMITDLLRNDLSKHAVIGSVQVPQLCALESFGQVHHLVTTIEATLAADANIASVLRDAFPGGSITGAPKKRVMEIIEDIEPTPRGLYCGSLFYWDASGHFDSNITIRTLVLKDGTLRTWAGGGITLDSQWQSEWEECGNKMGGIMRALEQR